MFNLVGFPLVLGFSIGVDLAFSLEELQENSCSWNTNESAYCTNLLHFKDIKHIKIVQK